jgi:plastocyanin
VSSGSAGPEPAADPTCDPTSPWLGARAEDVDGVFRLALTRTCVNAGTLKVDYFNNDASRHDVWIRDLDGGTEPREVIPEQNGGARAQGEVTISAGRWQLYCTLAGHTSMRATVTAITP